MSQQEAEMEPVETTVMAVWPSISVYPLGLKLGQLYSIRSPGFYVFRPGNLIALLSIPVALAMYFVRVAPRIGIRYRVTNRGVRVERGVVSQVSESITWDEFDEVSVQVLPGQQWYPAGDLVFAKGGHEVFRLSAVSWPEPVRVLCERTRAAYVEVKRVRLGEQAADSSSADVAQNVS